MVFPIGCLFWFGVADLVDLFVRFAGLLVVDLLVCFWFVWLFMLLV